uniref:Uncharacterized protein n=1 Tax=Ananas comosus var. bracteatus TaxID=296719 RepID=A0A6V7QQ43_ANACO
MPQLRGDARRGRAQPNPIVQAERPSNTRRRRAAAAAVTRSLERKEEIELAEGGDEVGGEENKEGKGSGRGGWMSSIAGRGAPTSSRRGGRGEHRAAPRKGPDRQFPYI